MGLERLSRCVTGMGEVFQSATLSDVTLMNRCRELLHDLICTDDWLPDELAKPHPIHYQQYLLHCDAAQRFSLVSFVWGPGQFTPIHDHTVWGLIGVLRGAELSQSYVWEGNRLIPRCSEERLTAGTIGSVSPADGTDIHRVRNAYADQTSISIHLYGGNIGMVKRHVYDVVSGAQKSFVSGYANTMLPNLWAPILDEHREDEKRISR